MILFTILFVEQIVLYILYFLKKRHDDLRYSALLQYIDRKVNDADCRDEIEDNISERLGAFDKKIDERFSATNRKISENYTEILKVCKTAFEKQDEEIDARFNAVALDYSQAQEAASKVNEFASGLASIFDYDPVRALQKGRNKEAI